MKKPVFKSFAQSSSEYYLRNYGYVYPNTSSLPANVFALYRDGFLSDQDLSNPERIASRTNIQATVPQKRRGERTESEVVETSMGNAFAKAQG